MKKALIAAAFGAATLTAAHAADLPTKKAPPPIIAVPTFIFADTQVYFDWKPFGREPGVNLPPPNQNAGANINKYIFGLTHFDVWQYGTNFFNVELLQSDTRDPPASSFTNYYIPGAPKTGATEVYGLYRGTLSFNALSGSKMFSFGPIKDISIGYGVDANTKNTSFAPEKKLVVAGPRIDFAVPGVLGVQFNVAHEWNYCGVCTNAVGGIGRSVSFRTTAEFEVVYAQPLTFTGLPLSFAGFTNFVMPKGRDGFGSWTKLEILSDNKLVLDFGKATGLYKPGAIDLFVGYKYWLNKFGNDHRLVPGSVESSVFAGVAWHIF